MPAFFQGLAVRRAALDVRRVACGWGVWGSGWGWRWGWGLWRTADERGRIVEGVAVGVRHCHPREVDEAVVHREGVEALPDTDEVAAGAVDLAPDLEGWEHRARWCEGEGGGGGGYGEGGGVAKRWMRGRERWRGQWRVCAAPLA